MQRTHTRRQEKRGAWLGATVLVFFVLAAAGAIAWFTSQNEYYEIEPNNAGVVFQGSLTNDIVGGTFVGDLFGVKEKVEIFGEGRFSLGERERVIQVPLTPVPLDFEIVATRGMLGDLANSTLGWWNGEQNSGVVRTTGRLLVELNYDGLGKLFDDPDEDLATKLLMPLSAAIGKHANHASDVEKFSAKLLPDLKEDLKKKYGVELVELKVISSIYLDESAEARMGLTSESLLEVVPLEQSEVIWERLWVVFVIAAIVIGLIVLGLVFAPDATLEILGVLGEFVEFLPMFDA